MHILRLETKEELLEILEWIFFRPDGSFSELCEARLSLEDVCRILSIDSEVLIDQSLEDGSDEWYEAMDNVDDAILKAYILSDRFEMVRNFTPGTLVWLLEDDWDRMGDLSVRVFTFKPDEETKASAHRQWRAEEQVEYEYRCKIADEVDALQTRHSK